MDPSTLLNHDGEAYLQDHGAVVPPIFQNSLFAFDEWDGIDRAFDHPADAVIYTRGTNPTVKMAEDKLAALAGGEKARLFVSGMAAVSAAILHCVKAGSHVITGKQLYGPANSFIREYLSEKCGVTVTQVDNSPAAFEAAIREDTSLIYLESPGSLKFEIQDIAAITVLAKKHGIKTVIDNTWASPLFQQPLRMGVDLEVHSCSKYLGGHSDIIAGAVIGKKADLDKIQLEEQAWLGAKMASFEAWLLLRSLRTLPIRMKQHMANAQVIAEYLDSHPKVEKAYFPGLPSFDGHELAKSQMSGFSSLMSFELRTDDIGKLKGFVNGLRMFKLGVSWGGHESLVYAPAISYLKEQSPDQIRAMGLSTSLIRISVGLEDPQDLIADLERGFEEL
jgi:cystathionine beta-lyase/cystathionine gamma-synthase